MSLVGFLNYLLYSPDRSIDIQYSYCSGVTALSFILAEYGHSIPYSCWKRTFSKAEASTRRLPDQAASVQQAT